MMGVRKPGIPSLGGISDRATHAVLAPVKETLELLTGVRGGQLAPLEGTPTTAELVSKINEIIARLNAAGE